jgi:L-threonylcarbamoyladenylate synthase
MLFEPAQSVLISGGVAVIPTDTIYGVVASALDVEAVERVYALRQREPDKPCIVLLSDASELSRFGITSTAAQQSVLDQNWPGPVSIILDCPGDTLAFLHRGTGTLAFRVPADEELRSLLAATGPLIAPSANLAGEAPATTVEEAEAVFGDGVGAYIDKGALVGRPSKLIRLYENGDSTVLRD